MTRRSRQIDDVAFLSWAKPTSAAPEHIRRAASEAIEKGLTDGYSVNAGLPELREEIAAKLRRDNGIEAETSQLMVTVGAIEGLTSALLAVVDPGDEVILPSPTYSTHVNQVRLASAVPVFAPCDEKQGFRLDTEAIREAITPRTRAVLYCSPCNPTGTVYAEEDLRELAAIALENDLMVITDEAYEYFVFDGLRHFSIGSIPEMRHNAISCFTFTKSYAMTGWRIGYLHADESWIAQISKPHIACAICAPVASQYAALAALHGPQDCIAEFGEHYRSARDLMCERLDRLSEVFDYRKPGGSYLMFPRIRAKGGDDSGAFCVKLLEEAHVSTTPGADFGSTGEGHLRMSFCVSEEMINTAFDRMERYFKASGG
ncbi:MAG: pyridoxal phosphate-dependent aminotransferase [Polyangia bacterium]